MVHEPTTCPPSADLKALLHGLCGPAEEAALGTHLESCPRCQQALQELAATGASWAQLPRRLRDTPAPPDEALLEALASLSDPTSCETLPTEPGEPTLDFLDPPSRPGHLGRLAGYEVLDVVGRGGMGVVLRALDPALERVVALKVLVPQLACLPSARMRFLREARAAARLDHDNIVPIHAVAECKGLPFLVMHYVDGTSLEERVREGPLPPAEVVRIAAAVARGLAAAHAHGLVHRDIKPANILLEAGSGRARITDFGLARAVDDASLTQSGAVAGTPAYMAPEQARGEPVDPRADLFSLGSVMYAMCTGHPPFKGNMPLAVLRRVADEAPPSLLQVNPSVPLWLEAIVARLHAREPAERFPSAAEVADLLERHHAHMENFSAELGPTEVLPALRPPRRPRRRRPGLWLGLAAAVALGVVAIVVVRGFLRPHTGGRGETADSSRPVDQEDRPVHAGPLIPEPKLSGRIEVALPEPFAQVRTGGGGRYLIFHLRKAKKLAIFDVAQVKITHEIDAPDDVLYAAGRDKLLVVLRGQRLLKRLDLGSGRSEKIESAPDGVRSVHMGCSSNGPLLLFVGGKLIGWDVETMKSANIDDKGLGGDAGLDFRAHVSADGQSVTVWHAGLLNQNYGLVHLGRPKNTFAASPDTHGVLGHWALPSADGRLVFRSGGGIYDGAMRPLPAEAFKNMILLPCEDPRFFLAVAEESQTTNKVSLCTSAERALVYTLGGIEKMTSSSMNTRWGLADGEPRVRYLSSANVLLSLPESNDRVVLRPLHLLEALDRSGQDYLFVLSLPERKVAAGSTFVYRLDVKSKAGGLRYKLESGPEGMTVSDDGVVHWPVPARPARPVRVILTIGSASGKEVQHAFDLAVGEPAGAASP